MARLNLRLLGSPRVEHDGQPIEVDTRKAIALLAYLALSAEAHPRAALAALFWPDVDEARSHAALRRTLSALNKALGGQHLLIEREALGLEHGPDVWVDVEQFHQKLAECLAHGHPASKVCPACLSPLTEAAALYRGDFLSGFTLRDSPGFDDWQFFQAESLRRELAGALERLVRGHSERGEFETAIGHARRWLSLDPLHEPAHRHLMQLYVHAGQRAAALRQYRECVRILEEELGVPPLEETTALYEAIKEQKSLGVRKRGSVDELSPTLPTPHALAPAPVPVSTYPLVGRAAEWARLVTLYDSIKTDGQLIVLEGEAGIGKTRLAEAFLQHARDKGAVALVAHCYAGEMNLAYAPFVEMLRAALAQLERTGKPDTLAQQPAHWVSESARLLPALAPAGLPPWSATTPLDTLGERGAQSRFFEGVSQLLFALCQGEAPGVLFFDDLHWADEASLDLLTYLARRLRGLRPRRTCLLAAWRGEQVPARHRLRHLLAEAQRAGAATLVPLSRLSPAAVTELVRSALPRAEPAQSGRLIERLYRESEGLPFFLVEYLAALAQGVDADWSLPEGVRGLLESRLAAISETGRQLLGAAAVIGRSFDFDTLQAASGRSDEEAVAGLEALLACGLVQEMPEDAQGAGQLRYDFSHEKLRAIAYDEISLARRRLLHRRVAEALASRARGRHTAALGPLAGQIAQHYQLAGREAEAADYFKLAGEHARALYANAEALAHFRAALALGHPDPAALHEAIGDLLTLLGRYGESVSSYETAVALCSPQALAGTEHKLGNVYDRRGEWDLAERHFQAALEALGASSPAELRARLYADWSLTAHRRGETARATELAQDALALAEEAADQRALAQAHNILGMLSSSQHHLDGAHDHLQLSLKYAETLGDLGAQAAALNNLALVFSGDGQADVALHLTEQALALCVSLGDRHREAALHNNLADLLHATGQAEAAMAHLKQAVTIFAEIGVEGGGWQPEIWKLSEW